MEATELIENTHLRSAVSVKILSRLGINHSEAINIFYSLIEEYKGFPFNVQLPSEGTPNNNVSPEVLTSLKESVKKNYRLGELLAK